jgi:hypothetical protein
LSIQMQDDGPVFWAEVDQDNDYEERTFAAVETGEQPPTYGEYIGTIQKGPIVLHYYELR